MTIFSNIANFTGNLIQYLVIAVPLIFVYEKYSRKIEDVRVTKIIIKWAILSFTFSTIVLWAIEFKYIFWDGLYEQVAFYKRALGDY